MTLTYDNNGNTLTQEDGSGNGVGYTYDAWNRLASNVVEVDGSPTDEGTPQEYGYMPGSQQASYSGCLSTLISDSYYDLGWQLLEKSTWTSSCCGPVVENVQSQYVWGLDYVNDLVERDDSTVSGDLGVEGSNVGERLYAQHDANFNVTAITDTSGAVLERFIYDPYGNQQKLDSSWATATSESVGPYILEFDVGFQGGVVYTDDGTIGPVLTGFQHRDYNPATGRWMQQDPAGYVDGGNLYQFVNSDPVLFNDPQGLWKQVGPTTDSRSSWESETGDSLGGLAGIVQLSPKVAQVNHWLKGGTANFTDNTSATTGSLGEAALGKQLCPKQVFSAPNVWIAANLMQDPGDLTNIGGGLGIAVGTGMTTHNKNIVQPTTFQGLIQSIAANSGNIWGIVIFGHGGNTGYLGVHDPTAGGRGITWGNQKDVIAGLGAQGFQLSTAYAMQCYSAFTGKDDDKNMEHFRADWNAVALRFFGYNGLNILGFGGH